MSDRRLIEVAFPLRETSLDSVHEKNVRQGHISTLHIWPARRPLAASRAALIATLLPDPGNDAERKELLTRLAGKVVEEDDKGKVKITTKGGILHWGRESGPDLAWFRQKLRKAYNGRAPRVLDPFSGGGAIPLEAMRLGCEAIAADINPVAWLILKCTLEYPQRLAGQTMVLPDFALNDAAFRKHFMEKGLGIKKRTATKAKVVSQQTTIGSTIGADVALPPADLAWHVRAWGKWVLERARAELSKFYPRYVDLVIPLDGCVKEWRLLASDEDPGTVVAELNSKMPPGSLVNPQNPRWVARPAVGYLWARTVSCKKCGAEIPLLKTRWLCRKENRRTRLAMEVVADKAASGGKRVTLAVERHVLPVKGTPQEQKAKNLSLGAGTMSRSGARCPCCDQDNTMDDLRLRGQDGKLEMRMTAVMIDTADSRDYRDPRAEELSAVTAATEDIARIFEKVPFGIPDEPMSSKEALGIRVPLYGFTRWSQLYAPRQLAALGGFVTAVRDARFALTAAGYDESWVDAIYGMIIMVFDRLADRASSLCQPDPSPTQSGVMHTFGRFALPMNWDFIEGAPLSDASGGWAGGIEWVALVAAHLTRASADTAPSVHGRSATTSSFADVDVVVTDPPYYDAIGYAGLMDFFYVWMRRLTAGFPDGDAFTQPLAPKWDASTNDGELIDDASRFGDDREASRRAYEDGMARSFAACHSSLTGDGRLVVVFAHKQPDAWETLVAAIIRAGFVVTGSWPIQTERQARTRSLSSAALSSSVWLVCRKRPAAARAGWDNAVLDEMRANVAVRLRQFWDDGIRGPDFVWAATGPAMEAYSKYPVVKKANVVGETMSVGEFLKHARKLVVEYVCARVLAPAGDGDGAGDIDPVTAYYLLHRSSFGAGDVPIGPCILFAVSCGLSDSELSDTWDVLQRVGAGSDDEESYDDGDEEDESDGSGGKGTKVRLKPWDRRIHKGLGETAPGGRPVPLIDRIHRAAQLRRVGNESDLNHFLQEHALSRNQTFQRVLQALIELADAGSAERAEFEALSNHIAADKRSSSQSTLFRTSPAA